MSPRYFYGIKGFLGNPVENHWSSHWNLIQPWSRFGEFWTTILSPLFSEERITPSFCRRNLTLMRQNLIHQKHWQNTFTTWTSGFFKSKSLYRVCHGFRDYWSEMIFLKSLLTTFEAAGAVAKIGLSLKPNRHNQVLPSSACPNSSHTLKNIKTYVIL